MLALPLYLKVLTGSLAVWALVLGAIVLIGHSIGIADFIGSLSCAVILAYWVHLWIVWHRRVSGGPGDGE